MYLLLRPKLHFVALCNDSKVDSNVRNAQSYRKQQVCYLMRLRLEAASCATVQPLHPHAADSSSSLHQVRFFSGVLQAQTM